MAIATVHGVRFDSERPCAKHTVHWNGRTFTAGSYLLAAMFAFQEFLDRKHKGFYLYVIQGAYNDDVEVSAGTHDKDGCIDVAVVRRRTGGKAWIRGRLWLRQKHFYAWLRNTGTWLRPSRWHIHAIVVGILEAGCPVGTLVPGQIADAKAGRTGLKGHARESSKIKRPKRYTPFPYEAWVEHRAAEQQRG